MSLHGVGGTKTRVVTGNHAGAHAMQSLDAILSAYSSLDVGLLKTDVDGFDYEVLRSGESLLSRRRPLVFFEAWYESEEQLRQYGRTIAWMHSLGYVDWTLFDNFGECVLRTGNVEHVCQLLHYVWRQASKAASRTIHYYDILAASAHDVPLVSQVLAEY